LATHQSAIKRARQNEVRYLRNKAGRTRVKNVVKAVRAAITEKKGDEARAALTTAIPVIQGAARKNVIQPNAASRTISRLTKQVNALSA
jgi:small subunit ribosomal protein S20